MKPNVARFLAPLALSEWGAILTYFYFSRRLAAFLHPDFRPLVLITGFLLLITAGCVLFFDDAFSAHDCEIAGCEQTHARLTTGGLLAFLILLLPIGLAARISPDSYGAVLIQNRGAAESLEGVPAVLNRVGRPTPVPVYVGVDSPTDPAPKRTQEETVDIPKGFVPPNAPEFSASKNVPEDDYPSNESLAAKLRADSNVSMLEAQKLPKATPGVPLRALNERSGAQTPLGTIDDVLGMADSPLHGGGVNALKQSDDGRCLAVEVVDLLVAAQNPVAMKELTGKRVEFIGQVLAGEGGGVRLLRLLVLCCAADAQPLAVRVETKGSPKLPPMSWAKVVGRMSFAKKGSVDVPVVRAEKITPVQRPDEPYLY